MGSASNIVTKFSFLKSMKSVKELAIFMKKIIDELLYGEDNRFIILEVTVESPISFY